MDEALTMFFERDQQAEGGLTARWVSVSTADGASHLEMVWTTASEAARTATRTKATEDELPRQRMRISA